MLAMRFSEQTASLSQHLKVALGEQFCSIPAPTLTHSICSKVKKNNSFKPKPDFIRLLRLRFCKHCSKDLRIIKGTVSRDFRTKVFS
jgi:hypothetical protein